MRDLNRPTAAVALHTLPPFARLALWDLLCSKALMTKDSLPPAAPHDAKAVLRADALRRRATAYKRLGQGARDQIVPFGVDLIAGLPGRCISGYWPIRDELDPLPLLNALASLGFDLALPAIEIKWAPLVFRRWRPGDTLASADFGLKEPLPSSAILLPDILLVPLAAFDSTGNRIGYGGGYYDRTVAAYRSARKITAIGIAFDEQEVTRISHETHDQRLDHVLTPTGARSYGQHP